MDKELTPLQDIVLRIVGIGDLLGIEGGLSKQQITDVYKLLEPVLKSAPSQSKTSKGATPKPSKSGEQDNESN